MNTDAVFFGWAVPASSRSGGIRSGTGNSSHPRHPYVHKGLIPSDGILRAHPQPSLAAGYAAECECETSDEPQNHPDTINALAWIIANTKFSLVVMQHEANNVQIGDIRRLLQLVPRLP